MRGGAKGAVDGARAWWWESLRTWGKTVNIQHPTFNIQHSKGCFAGLAVRVPPAGDAASRATPVRFTVPQRFHFSSTQKQRRRKKAACSFGARRHGKGGGPRRRGLG